jgi:hypothetical protein
MGNFAACISNTPMTGILDDPHVFVQCALCGFERVWCPHSSTFLKFCLRHVDNDGICFRIDMDCVTVFDEGDRPTLLCFGIDVPDYESV